jgi:hypothetical protein
VSSNIHWQKNCAKSGVMIRVSASLLLVLLLATACSTSRMGRFNEQEQANLVVRYYTDDTSYVLKPAKTDGTFLAVLNKDAVLDVAKQQPGRELAVVILIHYRAQSEADSVRQNWVKLLKEVGYQRVVFLRASGSMQINGLPVLAGGG